MAETLDINQLLSNEAEPKRMFRWVVEIDGIDAWTAKTFARPSQKFESVTIDYINQKRYIAGKNEWNTLALTLWDPIMPSASQKITQWLRLVHDAPTGRMGYAEMYKKNFSLKLLDGPGNVVEKWNVIGAWPMEVDFGELDYANSETATIQVTIRMDECRQEY